MQMTNGSPVPAIAPEEIYHKSLGELIDLRNDFAREKWKLRLAGDAHAEDRKQFSDLRAQIQNHIRDLTNARLSEIAGELAKNEADLREGIENCQAAREHFENIARAFAAFSAFLRVVGGVAKIAAGVGGKII
jgi:hypothetical protein